MIQMIVNVTSMFWSLDIYFLVCFFVSIVESYQDAVAQIASICLSLSDLNL